MTYSGYYPSFYLLKFFSEFYLSDTKISTLFGPLVQISLNHWTMKEVLTRMYEGKFLPVHNMNAYGGVQI